MAQTVGPPAALKVEPCMCSETAGLYPFVAALTKKR
jgi:hypothetical protein